VPTVFTRAFLRRMPVDARRLQGSAESQSSRTCDLLVC
jgi:hypothetical protein